MQTGRLAASFQGLNSSLAQSLCKWCKNVGFPSTNIWYTGAEGVNKPAVARRHTQKTKTCTYWSVYANALFFIQLILTIQILQN